MTNFKNIFLGTFIGVENVKVQLQWIKKWMRVNKVEIRVLEGNNLASVFFVK